MSSRTYPDGWLARTALLRLRAPLERSKLNRTIREAEYCDHDKADELIEAMLVSGALERLDNGKYRVVVGGGR